MIGLVGSPPAALLSPLTWLVCLRYRSVDMGLLAVLAPLPHLVHLTLRYWDGRRIGRKVGELLGKALMGQEGVDGYTIAGQLFPLSLNKKPLIFHCHTAVLLVVPSTRPPPT